MESPSNCIEQVCTGAMKQMRLLQSGCQRFNRDILDSAGDHFAYCSNLAVYIYSLSSKRVNKIIPAASVVSLLLAELMFCFQKTLAGVSFSRTDSDIFATADADLWAKRWNVHEIKPLSSIQLPAPPVMLEWCNTGESVAILLSSGQVILWTETAHEVIAGLGECTRIRWDWKREAGPRLAAARRDGSLCIWNLTGGRVDDIKLTTDITRPVVSDLQWDPISNNYVLISCEEGDMYLADTEQMLCQASFQSDAPIMMLAFTPDVPGNFVSIDHSLSYLIEWNVSNPIPIGRIKIAEKNCSVISLKRISGDFSQKLYMLAFSDGATGVYDLTTRTFDFLSQVSLFLCSEHSENMCLCETDVVHVRYVNALDYHSPDILATVSNEGTLKVWFTDTLECKTVLRGPDVLYAVSWCPGDEDEHRLITCSQSGQCAIWDVHAGKILCRFRHHIAPSYRVRWNPSDPNLICSTSVDMTAVVFTARDPNHAQSPGQVIRKYIHPNMVYGCDWNIFNKHLLATGCHDGVVRVFDVATTDGRPIHTLQGHRERVFNVEWSPLIPGVLASGSDDRTIRVWTTLTPREPPKVLTGHSHNIRGLSWSWEVPFLLLSGSWSGEIRVWDIRNEHCLQVLSEHHADVYGLVSHPKRPFSFASCSRDTSVRFWGGTESFVGRIQLESLLDGGTLRTPSLGDIKTAMNPHLQKVLLCGRRSVALARMVEDIKDNEMQRQQLCFEFFTAAPGTKQLFELMHSFSNNVPCDPSARMQNVNDLWKVQYSLAKNLLSTDVKIDIGGTRKHRQMQAGRLFLLLGCMKQYCDILVDLGEWDQAISLAPSVSVTYWRTLCERYADILMVQRDQKAVALLIASGRIAKLQEFQLACGRPYHADALVGAVTNSLEKFPDLSDLPFEAKEEVEKKKDIEKIVEEDEPEEEPETRDSVDVIPAILEMIGIIAAEFMEDQQPVMAACCHLAVGEPLSAARTLLLGDEVLLAECLVRCLQLEGADFVHIECAKRCEQLGMWDEALAALNLMDNPGHQINFLCARCDRSAHEKADFYAKAGIPAKAAWQAEAEASLKEGKKVDALTAFLCAGDETKCIEIAVELIHDILAKASWSLAELEAVIEPLNCVAAQLLPPSERNQVLMMSYLLAAQRAFTLGFGDVGAFFVASFQTMATRANIQPPISPSFLMMQELTHFACVDPARASILAQNLQINPQLPAKLKGNVSAIKKKIDTVYLVSPEWVIKEANNIVPALPQQPTRADKGKYAISIISRKRIVGYAVRLEDQRSFISLAEARMLLKCTPYSPLSTGYRLFMDDCKRVDT